MQRRWVIPVIAVVLALVTTLVIVQYLQGLRQPITMVQPLRLEGVIVAKSDIAGRSVIKADQVEVRQVPFNAIHPRAARRTVDVVNRVALSPIYADQQIVASAVAPEGVKASMSYMVPQDKRAMTIPVNEVVDVAGFVGPGDRVDVIGTVSSRDQSLSKIFLQDITVLAVAQTVEQKPGEPAHVVTSATLALTPDQAEILTQIDNNGKVRLALRPSGITTQVATSGKTTEAALALAPALVLASAPTVPSPAHKPSSSIALPPTSPTVEVWRGTQKTTVRF